MPNNALAFDSLLQHLAKISDTTQIDKLLSALLTDKEKQDLTNRIRIFDLLEQGIPQRDISQQLGVGIATVSRGAKALNNIDNSSIENLLATHRNKHDRNHCN